MVSLKDRVEHANVFKAAIETLSIKTNIARRSAGLKFERERQCKCLRTVPCCETHRPEEWRETTMWRVYTARSHLSVHLVPVYIKKMILALIVTRLPLGFFSKSSRSTFSPTISTAEGKFSLKNAAADSRVVISSREEKGMNKVRVNEPS